MNDTHLVIMAGGQGTRLFPLSTEECPKQFVDVTKQGRTLIQLTADRFSSLARPENTWVVTGKRYAALVREQLPEIPEGNILVEPMAKNTAPCVAYAAWRIKAKDPGACIIVSPADHVVSNTEECRKVAAEAVAFAQETDAIVTLGMKPTRPDTGFGYIEADLAEASARARSIFRVEAFREKPSIDKAREYVGQDNFFWNAGVFVWSVKTIVNALRVYAPSIATPFEAALPKMGTAEEQAAVDEAYGQCEKISIDYAVLEKAEEVFVRPAEFGWSDLGTWPSLLEYLGVSTETNNPYEIWKQIK